ncbi:MAG: Halolysin [ANME-2 cluster archaeon]|nr:Halolysin [ANME-2 cluster archaeon]
MKKSFLTLITFLAIILILLSGTAYSEEPRRDVIIGFHQMPIPSEKASIHSEGGIVKHEYRLIHAVSASLSEQAIDNMRKNPRVAYIEDDAILTIATDEYVNSTGVSHIGCEMAHNNGIDGTGVKVAVIDTGIDYTHEDLDANYKGGYDFVFNDSDPFDGDNGHGTHVAGIIAAERNGIGVVGVAPNASLYAVRVLDSSGFGTASWVIAGIEWAVDNDMDVVVMSFGTNEDCQSLREACRNASDAGVLLVAAAGNTHIQGENVAYPAMYDSVIAVTATDLDDSHTSFSPVGPEVELAAPGVNIRSTVVGDSSYGNLSGTSQAAPHVAGTAALIISSNLPDVNDDGVVNNEDVRLQLQSTARDLGDPGKDDTYGYGLVKAPITAAAISCDCGDICVSTGGWWHDGGAFNASGAPIQDAVDNASSGDTICVAAGSYNENVDVETDHLTIQSENGSVSTIVQAANSGNHVFEVIANYVNISGFNVTGATGTSRAGIYLNGADQCNISDNTASGNWDGIYLKFSNDNILLNNTASNNDNYGIELYDSSDNLIYNNYWSNTNNVYDGGSNRWNTTVTPVTTGSNIIGGPSIGGNYWSDYTDVDLDGDGLGNIPYNITGGSNFDYHPLCLSDASVKGDLNGDGAITPADAAIALRLAATGAHDDAADVSGDGAVTSLDALMILQAAAELVEL